ncbi:metalloendoproteinase 2-MMP-like [Tasmannia lanceolata]|uniref:metalloendoproteinase 2-MMP-like n=1 Tax=Tasmannia lanceolata TaxID=3420 RepID=UPI0040630048
MESIPFFIASILLALISTPISGFPNLPPNITAGVWQPFKQFAGCHPGQQVDGLAGLKQYFHRFGYIPAPSSNFSDNFDDALESAIKTYQSNFNLNVTGTLDNSTVQQIVRPRCGVADIINGTSSMNSGKALSTLHTVAHYTFFPGSPQWPSSKTELTYAFSTTNQLFDSQVLSRVFTRAFARWSAVVPLTFTETSFYFGADLKIGFFSGDHGDGEPFDGVLGTLAHSFSPTDGRFHLDAAENWVAEGDVSSSEIDLESVAVHEIGHLLGLGHTSVEDAIMFPSISSGTKKVELVTDDILGIQLLYGSNPNYNGSATNSTPSSQERDMNDGRAVGPGLQWCAGVGFSLAVSVLLL